VRSSCPRVQRVSAHLEVSAKKQQALHSSHKPWQTRACVVGRKVQKQATLRLNAGLAQKRIQKSSLQAHSYWFTPWSTALFEKLTVSQLVKNLPAFCGTLRFITALTSSRHLSLSWARSIQSMPPHPTSWKSILMISSHLRLGLPSGRFPSGFPNKTLYTSILSPIRATCPAPLILLEQAHSS